MSSNNGRSVAPLRRIVTTHTASDTDGSGVTVHDDRVPLRPVLDGHAHITPLYSASGVPATNPHVISAEHITQAMANVPGVVFPGGTNGQVTDVAPNFKIGMHRTSSIDYNIIIAGSATLIVPDGKGGETRTVVKAGELVVQTGTIHAWEAGPEGARWITVVIAALPVEKDGKKLEDVDF
ncbi:uncharacterized protein I303_103327 [Kwoniella dejecticola CBS 10117]|uniref:Cupin 2 conserved barrel domain-containing protein n=1 Tax=Kwoniella dejecticola CBS 10117 TaxID=1296121 RepID=A0A1A6A6F7_9TREE|nr:uncharacterized protein I303_03350 [Kwoniella dejecticola CBS 10117]OBR85639.1 hypothetical protein I303_03350 [Kwoniella dejecticola CBS 10117]